MSRLHLSGSFLLGAALFVANSGWAIAQEASPRLISPELSEVDSYVYPKIALLQQAGERVVVDALIIRSDKRGESSTATVSLSNEFEFNVPPSQQDSRICVDIASAKAGLRKLSLMKLVKPVGRVTAKIDFSREIDDTVIVAYPTKLQGDNPQTACLASDTWVFPIRELTAYDPNEEATLQLRINTGGTDAKVTQVGENGAAFGDAKLCERDEDPSGLFNRVCRLQLPAYAEDTRIRILIARRNAGSFRKEIRISLPREK
jgi:hypothetical protein